MSDQLNQEQIKVFQSLYSTSSNFRSKIDGAIKSEIDNARAWLSEIEKISATEESMVPAKKRGRPAGSKNKGPKKPRVKKDKPESSTEPIEMTHRLAIKNALSGNDGLGAQEILDAIVASKYKKYSIPSKNVLYTTLYGMKSEGQIKAIGDKPNTKYLLPS